MSMAVSRSSLGILGGTRWRPSRVKSGVAAAVELAHQGYQVDFKAGGGILETSMDGLWTARGGLRLRLRLRPRSGGSGCPSKGAGPWPLASRGSADTPALASPADGTPPGPGSWEEEARREAVEPVSVPWPSPDGEEADVDGAGGDCGSSSLTRAISWL